MLLDKNVLARRYGVAIFDMAKTRGNIDEIREALHILNIKYEEEESVRIFLTNPIITLDEKKFALEKMFEFLSEDAMRMLVYVVHKERVEYIPLIYKYFLEEVYHEEGKIPVIAIFAKEISDEQKGKLLKKLEEKYNKKIVLNIEIDESIIGGGIIKVGSNIINGSIKHQLDDMKRMF